MISDKTYQETVVNDKIIKEISKIIYNDWQKISFEEVGHGLGKGYYSQKTIFPIRTITYNEKEVYINARKEGALKIPQHCLSDPNWKDWLVKN